MKNVARIATAQHQMLVIHFFHLNETYTIQELKIYWQSRFYIQGDPCAVKNKTNTQLVLEELLNQFSSANIGTTN